MRCLLCLWGLLIGSLECFFFIDLKGGARDCERTKVCLRGTARRRGPALAAKETSSCSDTSYSCFGELATPHRGLALRSKAPTARLYINVTGQELEIMPRGGLTTIRKIGGGYFLV